MSRRNRIAARALATCVFIGAAPSASFADPAAGDFDDYVLALSWSPAYCEHHADDRDQCSGRRSGFVLHGLWPQSRTGAPLGQCATSRRLDAPAREFGKTVFPSETLVAHEWQRHGTCSGMEAADYLRAADAARSRVRIPPPFDAGMAPASPTTAADVIAAFRKANAALTASSIAAVCAGDELAEIRICVSKTLDPIACGPHVHGACPRGPLSIRAAR